MLTCLAQFVLVPGTLNGRRGFGSANSALLSVLVVPTWGIDRISFTYTQPLLVLGPWARGCNGYTPPNGHGSGEGPLV